MNKKSNIALLLYIASLVLLVCVCATKGDSGQEPSAAGAELRRQALPAIYSPVLPDTMTFAGERVPLDTYYVREGLDRELIANTYGHTSTLLYFKTASIFLAVSRLRLM